ncbi:MAG: S8 family peptidase [Bryobacterales bacterium]|nr:S8 family peptidase [Bryobacterales bacterium]
MSQIKQLDPRLRRLMRTMSSAERLSFDLEAGVIAAAAPDMLEAPPRAATVTKRVLCRLGGRGIPESLRNLRWAQVANGIYSVDVPLDRMEELGSREEVVFVEAGRPMSPSLDDSVPETKANLVRTSGPPLGQTGRGVVVGIIDFGLDYTLADFRNPDGSTRVAFLWDQALRPRAGESAPTGFQSGVEYTRAQIDAALQSGNPFAMVRHRPDPGSHGTHVASTAAGNGRTASPVFPANKFIGTAPEATLIFVQPATEAAAGSFTDSVRVSEAIAYIYAKAQELRMPCVINMSLGQNGGSHDGESLVERAIDSLLETPGRAFVVAAGNEHVWRGHASGELRAGDVRKLAWRTGGQMPLGGGGATGAGNDTTQNEMEIWYSSRDQLRVRITDPSGNATAFVDPGNELLTELPGGNSVFIDSERFTRLNGDARIYIEVTRGTAAKITGGIWTLEITAIEARNGRFDAWIERDARNRANNFADQSFFVGADFDPVMTIGTPATGRRSIAVANYSHVAQAPNESSGRGRTRDGRNKPEIAAPGTNITAAGALGGQPNPINPAVDLPVRVTMTGTSMAAPHVAGIAALLLAKRRDLTADQIRKILTASASPAAGQNGFDLEWGYGRVDAKRAVEITPDV